MPGEDEGLNIEVQQRLYEYEAEFEAQSAALQEAYAELARSRDRYRTLFDAAPVAMVVVDDDTRMLQVNTRAEALLGQPAERLLRAPLMSRVTPIHHLSLRANLDIAYSRGRPTTTVARLAEDTVETWVRVDCGRMDLGGTRRLLVVLHDITRQHLAEDGLRRSEARFRALFEASGDAVALLDGASLTLQEINPSFVRLTASAPEDLLGVRVRALFPEAQRWAVSATLRQALHHGEAGPLAVSLAPEGRAVRRVALTAQAVRVGGGLFAMISLRDMTEQWDAVQRRKEVERRLWQVNRVEMVGAMAGTVAEGVVDALEAIEERVQAALKVDGQAGRTHLQEALDAARRGKEISGRLLGLAEPSEEEAGVEFTVGELVADAIELARRSSRNIRVEVSIEEPDRLVQGDRGAIVQSLDHLLGVAAYSRSVEHGIILSAQREEVPSERGLPDGQRLCFEIRGDLLELDLERLRASSEDVQADRSAGQGANLGFASARLSLGEQGGGVSIEERPPRILAWLPLPVRETPEPEGPVQTVLVLEHEPMVRRATSRQLTADGYRVRTAATLDECLEHLKTESFDALILDREIVGERASELCRAARESRLPPRLVAVGEAFEGADAVLTKPYGTHALRQALG